MSEITAVRTRNDHRLLILLGILILIPWLDLLLPQSLQVTSLMPPVLISCIVGLGLTVATGFAGLLHLGVAAFVAIGAYTFAIATCSIYPFQLPWGVAILLASAMGAIFGLLLATPMIRLRGDYLAIVTLGFGEIVQDVLRNLDTITKGTVGINPLPAPKIIELGNSSPIMWYYLVLLILGLVSVVLQRLSVSPIGRAWIAIREDELAASCMGIQPARVKLSAFAISAALCALAGSLLASFLGSSGEPSNYDFQLSIMALSMVIVGGLGSVPGAILGGIIMGGINSIVLAKAADQLTGKSGFSNNVLLVPGNWKYIIFGLALVLMMRFRSQGLMPPRVQIQPEL